MTAHQPAPDAGTTDRLAILLELLRRARAAGSVAEGQFLAVNESHHLAPYRQAGLWSPEAGVEVLSGLVSVEENAPYVGWLDRLCRHLSAQDEVKTFETGDLPPDLAAEHADWAAAYGLWAPIQLPGPKARRVGLVFLRDMPWTEMEAVLLREWLQGWSLSYGLRSVAAAPALRQRLKGFIRGLQAKPARELVRERWVQIAAAITLVVLFPIRISVLAPAELTPAHPAVLRAPSDGVIDAVLVEPNQRVKAGQPLFRVDTALLKSQREAAEQALAAAEEEYRQTSQQALTDDKARSQLPELAGKLEERRAQSDYAQQQAERSTVVAPNAGVAIFDDPTQLIGRPVAVGERVMRVSDPQDIEIEAWVAAADAIPLQIGGPVSFYMDARPLSPAHGKLRYFSHEPTERPGGAFAYRTRATLNGAKGLEVGLKGTARLEGGWAPVGYWVLRRPIGAIRAKIGF